MEDFLISYSDDSASALLPFQQHSSAREPWSSFEALRLDQIRTVDRRRLVRHLGVVDSPIMAKVGEALKISLGLVYL